MTKKGTMAASGGPKSNGAKAVYCIDGCKFDRGDHSKPGADMVGCCVCEQYFHLKCLQLPSRSDSLYWECGACITKRRDLFNLQDAIASIRIEIRDLKKKITTLEATCRDDVVQLREKISTVESNLGKACAGPMQQRTPAPTPFRTTIRSGGAGSPTGCRQQGAGEEMRRASRRAGKSGIPDVGSSSGSSSESSAEDKEGPFTVNRRKKNKRKRQQQRSHPDVITPRSTGGQTASRPNAEKGLEEAPVNSFSIPNPLKLEKSCFVTLGGGNKVIVGDSIVKYSGQHAARKGFSTVSLPGATVQDIQRFLPYIEPTVKATPTELVLHVGTNNIRRMRKMNPDLLAEAAFDLLCAAREAFPNCCIVMSGVLHRYDVPSADIWQLNKSLFEVCSEVGVQFIDVNFYFDVKSVLNGSGLHLNHVGSRLLANVLTVTKN